MYIGFQDISIDMKGLQSWSTGPLRWILVEPFGSSWCPSWVCGNWSSCWFASACVMQVVSFLHLNSVPICVAPFALACLAFRISATVLRARAFALACRHACASSRGRACARARATVFRHACVFVCVCARAINSYGSLPEL